jgi:hypothetical protein
VKCADFHELVEDYSEGMLDRELSAGIQLHLGECPECLALLERIQAEERLYREYGRKIASELKVNPVIWPQIRSALERASVIVPELPGALKARRRAGWWHPFWGEGAWRRQLAFSALLVVISVAGTLLVVRYQSHRNGSPVTQEVSVVPMAREGAQEAVRPTANLGAEDDARSLEAAMRALQRAERDYLEAIQILSDIVERRKPTLEARTVKELEENLRALDARIEATRKAYHSHPSDPYLAQHMLTAYRQKVELLQELAS